ncbi:unnamed protein product [Lymnaea stagnalis]|uniref:F-box domain-containing protein n=1 Tax=Lymnaea stagnalis TaxID=6523 RepID=A0AAV2HGP3_LYMST
MKIKVKFDQESRIIDLGQIDPSTTSLEAVKIRVTAEFHLEGHEFHLSLNKNDALTDESQLLADIGIVSGDLLHIIGPGFSQTNGVRTEEQLRNRRQPLAPYSGENASPFQMNHGQIPLVNVNADAHMSTTNITAVSSLSAMSVGSYEDLQGRDEEGNKAKRAKTEEEMSDINRYLSEPLVVRESTATQVPILLHQLYVSADCKGPTDALWVVLHALMLESGFVPNEDQDPSLMPSDWKKSGYYACTYQYTVSSDTVTNCSMVGVTMGTSMAVHAYPKVGENYKTDHLQLKAADFVRLLSSNPPEVYRALDRLSRQFMDTISLPLINELDTAAGFPGRQGLLALPYVAKLKLLSFLGAKSLCRLGQTCQEFAALYKDKTLWRLLYIRDFGKPDDCSLSRNWFDIYKAQHLRRMEELEQRRRLFHVDATDPPWGFPIGPFRPMAPRVPFPRMLGGDYDLHPEFAAGFPDPFNRRPQLPNVVIPNPLSGDLTLGRPGRGNMTGSPFAHNTFHGPFM